MILLGFLSYHGRSSGRTWLEQRFFWIRVETSGSCRLAVLLGRAAFCIWQDPSGAAQTCLDIRACRTGRQAHLCTGPPGECSKHRKVSLLLVHPLQGRRCSSEEVRAPERTRGPFAALSAMTASSSSLSFLPLQLFFSSLESAPQ